MSWERDIKERTVKYVIWISWDEKFQIFRIRPFSKFTQNFKWFISKRIYDPNLLKFWVNLELIGKKCIFSTYFILFLTKSSKKMRLVKNLKLMKICQFLKCELKRCIDPSNEISFLNVYISSLEHPIDRCRQYEEFLAVVDMVWIINLASLASNERNREKVFQK